MKKKSLEKVNELSIVSSMENQYIKDCFGTCK